VNSAAALERQMPLEAPPAAASWEAGGRIASLDGVRGLAILGVMLFHMTILPTAGNRFDVAWLNLMGLGWSGVTLFFVLSGFLITGILFDSKDKAHYFRNFYARRVLRIFPLYYAVVFFCLVVLPQFDHPKVQNFGRIEGEGWWYWLYLSNFLIFKTGQFRHGVLDVSWSLAIEEQFYLVWPIVVLLLNRRALMWLCGAIVLTAVATRCAMIAGGVSLISVYAFTLSHVDALAIGAFLALAARSPGGLRRFVVPGRLLVLLGVATILGLATARVSLGGDTAVMTGVGYTLLALMYGGLLVLALEAPNWSRAFANPFLRTLGKYSYALYLFNNPIRAVVRDLVYGPASFATFMGSAMPGQILFYVLSFALTLPLAWLSWHLFEKHFLALKRLFDHDRAPARRGAVGAPVAS
jgi:peptidoglycan/LPS O-acetylase OafA/YrhL